MCRCGRSWIYVPCVIVVLKKYLVWISCFSTLSLRLNVYCRQQVICFLSKLVLTCLNTTGNSHLTAKPDFLSLVDFQELNLSRLILGTRGTWLWPRLSCVRRTLSTILFSLNTKWLSEYALLNGLFHLKTLWSSSSVINIVYFCWIRTVASLFYLKLSAKICFM